MALSPKTSPVAVADCAPDAVFERAKDRALALLARRAWGRRELARRLERDFDPPVVSAVIERLQGAGLIDDAAFAIDYAKRRAERAGLGSERVRSELLDRGVDGAVVEAAVAGLLGDSDRERASAVLDRFFATRSPDDPKAPAAAARRLLSRGFDEELVRDLLRDLLDGS